MPLKRSAIGFGAISFIAMAPFCALAQSKEGNTMTVMPAARTMHLPLREFMPADYREVSRNVVSVDGAQAELVRYQRIDGRNATPGGEHFSEVISPDGRLKGFARIDLDLVGGDLPSREDAQSIAMDFLREHAPDLLASMKVSWIDPHDEPLRVSREGKTKTLTLTGMKVKMRNTADGLWFWVIVGADRKVMVFERDIRWITFPGHRGTEKWLHDSWLARNGHLLRAL